MPIAVQEMHRRNINPSAFVVDGRHPGDTLKNFKEWQNKTD